ncbi:MAG TPA: hypothetical protein VMG12_24535 [Polyangiaceae bacterium]|nr:hypothetical protein [Polyangiaceae bacterium]
MSLLRLLGYGAPLALEAAATALVLDGRALGGGSLHALATALAYGLTLRWLGTTTAGAAAADASNASAAPSIDTRSVAAASAAALVLVLPVVGAAVLAFVAWPSWTRRSPRAAAAVVEVPLPDGSIEIAEPAAAELARGPRPIRQLLRDSESPDERVRAVMALRHMDARRAVPLLRLAFAHESEDVRLLAFGILEQREKRLRSRIELSESRLSSARNEAAARPARWHQRLARDHWELVYGGFVSGDLEPTVLAKARDHAEAALACEPGAKMAVLLARIYLRRRQPEAARKYLEQAQRAGLPAASLAPLFAEAAFQLRRFEEIPTILGGVRRSELRRPELEPIAEYWTGQA